MVHTTSNPSHCQTVAWYLLHASDNTLLGWDVSSNNMGPAVSNKKVLQEGCWGTSKETLGWQFDNFACIISLPPKKQESILALLHEIGMPSMVYLKTFKILQGKLQFASIAITCGKALLCPTNHLKAKAQKAPASKLHTTTLKALLDD